MNRPIAEMVDAFFDDLARDSRAADEKSLRAWLWFTCDASLRSEVEPAIRADERWINRASTQHVRKQVYLRPDQDRAIRLAAADRGIDDSQIVREAVDQYLAGKK